jgi:hypothetical protein
LFRCRGGVSRRFKASLSQRGVAALAAGGSILSEAGGIFPRNFKLKSLARELRSKATKQENHFLTTFKD